MKKLNGHQHLSIHFLILQSSTDISDTSASSVESDYNSNPTLDKHRNKSHTLTSLDVESIVKPVTRKKVLHKKWTRKNNDGKIVDRESAKHDPLINIKRNLWTQDTVQMQLLIKMTNLHQAMALKVKWLSRVNIQNFWIMVPVI